MESKNWNSEAALRVIEIFDYFQYYDVTASV